MRRVASIAFAAIYFGGEALAVDVLPGAQIETLAKSTASWDGRALPRYPHGTPEVTILRIRIPPGGLLPLHEHPVINAAVLLRGEVEVKTTTKTFRVHAGDGFVEVVNQWHSGKNVGNETAEFIVFYAGTPTQAITVKK